MRTYVAAGWAVGLALWAVGCGPTGGDEPAPTPGAGKRPLSGGRVTIAVATEPASLNPIALDSRNSAVVLGMIHFGLVRKTPRDTWDPGVASSWGWSEDGDQLTLRLRDDLRWSDGDPVDAADIVSTYALARDEANPAPSPSLLAPIDRVEQVDAHTVRFTYADVPLDPLANVVLNPLPSHLTADLDVADLQSWDLNRAPVTLGPFRVAEWRSGESIRLERNPHYPDRAAYLEEVVVTVVPDPSTRLLQLEAGEIDVMDEVPVHEVARLRARADIQLHAIQGRRMVMMIPNVERPALGDRRVRRAISLSIDRAAMVEGLLYGFGDAAASAIVPLLWAHHADLAPDRPDPARAAGLLDDAGWVDPGQGPRQKDGRPLTLELLTRAGNPILEGVATRIQAELGAVGFAVSITPLDAAGQIGRMQSGDFDASVMSAGSPLSVDPSLFFSPGSRMNLGRYDNPAVSTLMERGNAADDREAAGPVWRELQELLHEEQPWIMLYYPQSVAATRVALKDAHPNYLSVAYGIENWWRSE